MPQTVFADDQIVAVTQLASGREMMHLYGIKNLCVGVHPLPPSIKSKTISELTLANIINDQVDTLALNNDPETATHLLSLQLKEEDKNIYGMLLTVVALRAPVRSLPVPVWSLRMKANRSGSGNFAPRINELVKRGALIFCRNYQIANSNFSVKTDLENLNTEPSKP